MAIARPISGGGYMVETDDGRQVPSAWLPPGVTIASAASPPVAQGPDLRTASLGIPGAQDFIGPHLAGGDRPAAPATANDALTFNAIGPAAPPKPPPPKSFGEQIAAVTGGANPELYGAKPVPEKTAEQQPAPGGVMANRPVPQSMPQSPGYTVIKGGERKVGETMQTTTVDPEAQAGYESAMDQRARTANAAGAQAKGHGDAIAGMLDRTGPELARMERDRQAAEASRQQAIAGDVAKLDQLRQESAGEVDNNRLFAKQTTGERLWSAISLGLAELGANMQGKDGSTAMKLWMKRMDDDIQTQKDNLANKRAQVGLQQGKLAAMREQFSDERQAELATKASYLEWAQSKIAAEQQYAQSDEQKTKLQMLADEIGAEKAKTLMAFGTTTHNIHTQVVPDRVVGGPAAQESLDRGLVVQDVAGNKYLARDSTQARELNTKRALTQSAVAAATEMRQIANKSGFEKLSPGDPSVQQFNFARERYVNAINTLMGQGVVKDDDIQRYKKDILGGPYGLATAKIAENFARQASTGYSNALTAGADTDTPLNEGQATDAKGRMVKRVTYDWSRDRSHGGGAPSVQFTPAGGR